MSAIFQRYGKTEINDWARNRKIRIDVMIKIILKFKIQGNISTIPDIFTISECICKRKDVSKSLQIFSSIFVWETERIILGIVKRNPLLLHEIEWKNNGFLFTTWYNKIL